MVNRMYALHATAQAKPIRRITDMEVKVWLMETSVPMVHDAMSTYTKGRLYCVMCRNLSVFKYPVEHIFRIEERTKGELNE